MVNLVFFKSMLDDQAANAERTGLPKNKEKNMEVKDHRFLLHDQGTGKEGDAVCKGPLRWFE